MSFAHSFVKNLHSAANRGAAYVAEQRSLKDAEERAKAKDVAKLRKEAKAIIDIYPETFDSSDINYVMSLLSAGRDVHQLHDQGRLIPPTARTSQPDASESPVRSTPTPAQPTKPMYGTPSNTEVMEAQNEGTTTHKNVPAPAVQDTSSSALLSNQAASQMSGPDVTMGQGSEVGASSGTPTGFQGSAQGPVNDTSSLIKPPATQQAGIMPREPDRGMVNFEMPAADMGFNFQGPVASRDQAMPASINEFEQLNPLDAQTQDAFNQSMEMPSTEQLPAAPNRITGDPSTSQQNQHQQEHAEGIIRVEPQSTSSPRSQEHQQPQPQPQQVGQRDRWTIGPAPREEFKSMNAGKAYAIQNDPRWREAESRGDHIGMQKLLAEYENLGNSRDETAWESFTARVDNEENLSNLRVQQAAAYETGQEDRANYIERVISHREEQISNQPTTRTWGYRPGSTEPEWLAKDSQGRLIDPSTNEPIQGGTEVSAEEATTLGSMLSEARQELRTLSTVSENRDRFVQRAHEVNAIVQRTNGRVLLSTTDVFSGLQTIGLETANVVTALNQLSPLSIINQTAEDIGVTPEQVSSLEGDEAKEFMRRYQTRMISANEQASTVVNGVLQELNLLESSDPNRRALGQLLEDHRRFKSEMTFLAFEAGRVEGLEGRALSNLNYNEIKNALENPRTPQAFAATLSNYALSIDRRARSDIRTALDSEPVQIYRKRFADSSRGMELGFMPNLRLAQKAGSERNIGMVAPVAWMEFTTRRMGSVTEDEFIDIQESLRGRNISDRAEYNNALVNEVIAREEARGNRDFGLDSMVAIGNSIYIVGPNSEQEGMFMFHPASGNIDTPLRVEDVLR